MFIVSTLLYTIPEAMKFVRNHCRMGFQSYFTYMAYALLLLLFGFFLVYFYLDRHSVIIILFSYFKFRLIFFLKF